MFEATLNSGYHMPMAIFGVTEIPKPIAKQTILTAIRTGYTHIDTSEYSLNEPALGEALSELFTTNEKSRSQVFITTKVFMSNFRKIRESLLISLQKLQLTYVDLYLLHCPFALVDEGIALPEFSKKLDRFPLHLAWAQMEALVDEGLVRSIGVSNWTIALLNDMFGYARILPAVNQFEINPFNKRTELVEYCLKNGVVPVGYRVIYRPVGTKFGSFQKCALDEVSVKEVSEKCGRTPAQVLLAWCLLRGCGCVSKTVSEERMKENLGALEVRLDKEDMEKINGISEQGEYVDTLAYYGIAVFK